MGKREKAPSSMNHTFDIDYTKLADAIVKAQNKATADIEKKKQDAEQAEMIKWQNTIGLKSNKPFSYFTAFWKLMFLRKKDVVGDHVTTTLLMFIAKGLMQLVMLLMFAVVFICVMGIIMAGRYFTGNLVIIRIELLILAIIFFILGNLFRVSSYEIEKMENKDYLNTILTSILTIFGTVLAVISLVK